jgi:DNA replication licensing factor MCM5
MAWAPASIFTTELHADAESGDQGDFAIRKRLLQFLRSFTLQNAPIYREQVHEAVHTPNPYIEVDLDHVSAYDEKLGHSIFGDPVRCLSLFEQAAYECAKEISPDACPIQVLLRTSSAKTPIRNISSSHIGKLIVVPGLVIATSQVTAQAVQITAVCTGCKHHLTVNCRSQGFVPPRKCQRQSESTGGPAAAGGSCPLDPYVVVPEFSKFADIQYLKIQESPEDVPPGEMPRHISGSLDRALANASVPGTRHLFVAIYEMRPIKHNIQRPVLRVVGLMEGQSAVQAQATDAPPEDLFKSREEIIAAIAPEIYGMDDVKEAIACQLFSGVRKELPDAMKIRGDINVLLFGDPSVAKSQLLKFAYRVAPIGVYTSGKGSSAAGLTASVIRHTNTGEFVLEGGAMVLADGGIVCIDEFDKMRQNDRVAIHEAMEQQTISIAKAGITAVLNTRTAVLAAANPVLGRFDDLKSASDNIDFQTTILSRFDLIFVLRDVKNEERDRLVAEHVVRLHASAEDTTITSGHPSDLKRYISHARKVCSPVISESAMALLQNEYVRMRSTVSGRDSIPITVRQLEALIRITESLAKMSLSNECTEEHVQEALRLFKVSTFDAASSGISAPEGPLREEHRREAERIQRYLERRCPIGSRVPERLLFAELQKQNFSEFCIVRVLQTMLYTGEFEYQNQRRVLKRLQVGEVQE